MKILQAGHQTWPKFRFGRFVLFPAIFSARNFCQSKKVTFFGRKNDSMTKLTRALHKARVSVFGIDTNISIDFMVIEKFAKLAAEAMSKVFFLKF